MPSTASNHTPVDARMFPSSPGDTVVRVEIVAVGWLRRVGPLRVEYEGSIVCDDKASFSSCNFHLEAVPDSLLIEC